MKQSIKPIVSLVAFLIGVLLSNIEIYVAVIFFPVVIFLLFHFALLAVVVHQVVIRESNRSQVIGKGVLAVIAWLVPSFVMLFITLGYIIRFDGQHLEITITTFSVVTTGVASVLYALIGLGLIRWVKNPGNEGLGMWKKDSR